MYDEQTYCLQIVFPSSAFRKHHHLRPCEKRKVKNCLGFVPSIKSGSAQLSKIVGTDDSWNDLYSGILLRFEYILCHRLDAIADECLRQERQVLQEEIEARTNCR